MLEAPEVEQTVQNIGGIVEDFAALRTLLLSDGTFPNYLATAESENVISLVRDDLKQIFLGPSLWQSFEDRLPYLDLADSPDICIVCVGKESELGAWPPELGRPDIQQLGLPITPTCLKAVVQSTHNLLTLMSHRHSEFKELAEASENVKYVMSISRELNGERDIPQLLQLILTKARDICSADAGSIYTVDTDTKDIKEGTVRFRLTQNFSVKQNLTEFRMPINEGSVVGNACIHQFSINIPDLYKLGDDPSKNPYGARHDRTWDKRIGYESHSMLTVPMFDISHNVIGVIQLINRKKDKAIKLTSPDAFETEIIAFDEVDQEYAEIVAQQAGIALENANMQEEIQNLFDGFVNASVTAIEQRDPTTSGHSHRVAHLTTQMAEVINRTETGLYGRVYFNADQIQEIEYASLLHDFGKLGVREAVLVKSQKLYPWEMEGLMQRFELIRNSYEIEYLKNIVTLMESPDHFPMGTSADSFKAERDQKLAELERYFEFVAKANEPTVLEQGGFEKLKDIANLTYKKTNSRETQPFLKDSELKALSVSRGSLTREEFAEIQSHVSHTFDFLRKIPWGRRLSNVPQIAAKHHEKLDGSGYPTSAAAEEIPVQTRLMTISDIFDALTAADRPYKRAVPLDKALDILDMEVKGGKLDGELLSIFKEAKVYEAVLQPGFRFRKSS